MTRDQYVISFINAAIVGCYREIFDQKERGWIFVAVLEG